MGKPPEVMLVLVSDPENRLVVFQFDKPINRLELEVSEAMELASSLIHRAASASGKSINQLVHEQKEKNGKSQ